MKAYKNSFCQLYIALIVPINYWGYRKLKSTLKLPIISQYRWLTFYFIWMFILHLSQNKIANNDMNKGKHGLLSHVENQKQIACFMTSYFQVIWKIKTIRNMIDNSSLVNKWRNYKNSSVLGISNSSNLKLWKIINTNNILSSISILHKIKIKSLDRSNTWNYI